MENQMVIANIIGKMEVHIKVISWMESKKDLEI